jgi:alanine racemase
MAVVKADAYGHELDGISSSISSLVDGFAVATILEGIQCRGVQDHKPVVVLSELWRQDQLVEFERHSLDAVIHSESHVKWLEEYNGRPLNIWIKFDTGMNRLGIRVDQVGEVYDALSRNSCLGQIRLMSHLASADQFDDPFTEQQQMAFDSCVQHFECEASLANSAGIMKWPASHYNWVRPGIMLYGVSPLDQPMDDPVLRPVMELQARLIAVKNVDAGETIGYGRTYRTTRPMEIALVGLGYGDGYPRVIDSRACVLVGDKRAPVVGRISMDMITIDVSDMVTAQPGAVVTLWGEALKVEEVASWANTIPYELLCKVTTRIPRIFR